MTYGRHCLLIFNISLTLYPQNLPLDHVRDENKVDNTYSISHDFRKQLGAVVAVIVW
jgi:hypothetical protein